jgi:hypothetical protein
MTTTETFPVIPWAEVREGQTVLYDGAWQTVAEIDPQDCGLLWVRFEEVTTPHGNLRTHDVELGDLVAVRHTTEEGQ